ncbi:putative cystathionine gamma-lyase 2 isoform X2 [Sitodiplosis mosellana]|nr:putative cystathionine gamma-lyase 2 isoform X2 [Sitodiplosis mosellana]
MADSKENTNKDCGFATRAIHAGQEYDQWSNAEIVPPIVTSITYYQNNPAKMECHFYSRMSNPTRDSLERCLAALEDSKHALVFPSGSAAVTALLHLLESGDHIVASVEQYGGTRLLLIDSAKHQKMEVDFVDSQDVNEVEAAIKPNTKLIWIETPSNPCVKMSDIAAIAKVARSREGIIFAVDNTLLTPYFQRPLELGADISMYSCTKYMNGHNDVLAGALMFNSTEFLEGLQMVQQKYGSILPAFDCSMLNRGLKTLSLRMEKHCENGVALARYLEKHPKVVSVSHPVLPSHPHYELAKKQTTGNCGLFAFRISGTVYEAKKFIQSLRIFASSGSLGSFSSFAMIPVCVSHTSLTEAEREKFGIFDTTIRLSVGIENVEDLIKDLEQALDKTFK